MAKQQHTVTLRNHTRALRVRRDRLVRALVQGRVTGAADVAAVRAIVAELGAQLRELR